MIDLLKFNYQIFLLRISLQVIFFLKSNRLNILQNDINNLSPQLI